MKKIVYLLSCLSIILQSCETDINISDQWENIPVIYSILDPKDTIHYIRVNRVFSGNASGYEMASHADSLIYNADLNVTVRVKDEANTHIKTLIFNKMYLKKDSVNASGNVVFAVDKHHVYYSTENLPSGKNYTYELEVILPDSKKITAVSYPLEGLNQKKPGMGEQYTLKKNQALGSLFSLPKYSGGVKMNIYIHYYEYYSDSNYTRKTIMFPIKMQRKDSNADVSLSIKVNDVFKRFKEELTTPTPAGMIRYLGKIDFEYVIADENYAEHIWRRTGGLSNEMPPITNIVGGYGLFACRSYVKKVGFKPAMTAINAMYDDAELRNLYGFGSSDSYVRNNIHLLP